MEEKLNEPKGLGVYTPERGSDDGDSPRYANNGAFFGKGLGNYTPERKETKPRERVRKNRTVDDSIDYQGDDDPRKVCYNCIEEIDLESTRLGDEGFELAFEFIEQIEGCIKQEHKNDNQLHLKTLATYLKSIPQFLRKMSVKNLNEMYVLCKNIGDSISNSRNMQLLNLKLILLYFSQIPKEGDPIISLSKSTMAIIDQVLLLEGQKADQQYKNINQLVDTWIAVSTQVPAKQQRAYAEYFSTLRLYFEQSPDVWRALIYQFATLTPNQNVRNNMLMELKQIDIRIEAKARGKKVANATEQVLKTTQAVWQDTQVSPSDEERQMRQGLLEDMDKVHKIIADPNNPVYIADFNNVKMKHNTKSSKAWRAIGIALLVLGITLVLASVPLGYAAYIQFSHALIPKLIADNMMIATGTTFGTGALLTTFGALSVHRGQPDAEGREYMRLDNSLSVPSR